MNTYTKAFQATHRVFSIVAIFAMLLMTAQGLFVQTAYAAEAANLDQAENGKSTSPITPVNWVNGAVNHNNGHYVEGQSIPYRMKMTNLTTGVQNTLIIEFDVLKAQGQDKKFAIDYITSDDRINETVDPCIDSGGICADSETPTDTEVIPAPNYSGSLNGFDGSDVQASFTTLVGNEGAQYMKLWNATFDSITYSLEPNLTNEDSAQVTVVFTPSSPDVVLSWGGHISSSVEYPGHSAVDISGNPYHTRLISLNGAGGNQDMALSASAVTPQGNVTVTKTVVNNNGGTLQVSDFPLFVDATEVISGESNVFDVDTYTVSETGDAGYLASDWGGDCQADGTLVVEVNQTYNCTITNDDIAPSLTLTKIVTGGPATASDFEVKADGPSTISGNGSVSSDGTFKAGIYTLSETDNSGVSGNSGSYSQGTWSCTGDVTNSGNEITLGLGESADCTITNTFVPADSAVLHVTKNLIQDNGGTEGYDDFSFYFDGVEYNWASTSNTKTFVIPQSDLGVYSVTENEVSAVVDGRYTVGYSNCTDLDLSFNGAEETCTITNDDIGPEITVIKHVVDTAMPGDKNADDFTMTVTGTNVSSASFAGSETGTDITLDAGAYSVGEQDTFGYTMDDTDPDCSGSIDLGETKTCTITNTEPDPTVAYITFTKVVNNNYGGTATSGQFTFNVGGDAIVTNIQHGETIQLGVGDYGSAEFGPDGYNNDSITGICAGDGTFSIEAKDLGSSFDCTYTNSDIQPKLTVIKMVENDNLAQVGTAVSSDFTMVVTGASISTTTFAGSESGEVLNLDAGDYNVAEEFVQGYELTYSGDCDASGDVTLNIGDDKTCVLTNNDIPPTHAIITFVKKVNNNYGGTAVPGDFSFVLNDKGVTTSVAHGGSVKLGEGVYTVTETSVDGYEFVSNNGFCNGGRFEINYIDLGRSYTCEFTNQDIEPQLTVTKVVQGGTAVVSDFALTVTDNGDSSTTSVVSGDTNGFNAGSYTVSESADPNYTATFSGDCDANGNVDLAVGDDKECTITNSAYTVTGFKWHDEADLVNNLPPNGAYDSGSGGESRLAGWEIIASSSAGIVSTFTDGSGYYTLALAPGEWEISEVMQPGWMQTGLQEDGTPVDASTCVFDFDENSQSFDRTCDFGNYLIRQPQLSCDLFEASPNSNVTSGSNVTLTWETTDADEVSIDNGVGGGLAKDGSTVVNPTADTVYTLTARRYIDVQDYLYTSFTTIEAEYEEVTCQVLVDVSSGGGGGGGSASPRCTLFDATRDGDNIVLNWETRNGSRMEVTADGEEVYSTEDDNITDEGDFTFLDDGQTEFELTVYRGTRSRSCTANLVGPTPLVLGEQVSAVPLGAADTGAGGASPIQLPTLTINSVLAILRRK